MPYVKSILYASAFLLAGTSTLASAQIEDEALITLGTDGYQSNDVPNQDVLVDDNDNGTIDTTPIILRDLPQLDLTGKDTELYGDPLSLESSQVAEEHLEAAMRAYESGAYETALLKAKDAHTAGSRKAALMIGHIYGAGYTNHTETETARKWYEKAAEYGSTDAMVVLGTWALDSQAGLSPAQALEYLSRAAQSQRADAMRLIGEMYLTGTGINQDLDKGREWLTQAHSQKDPHAARKLADSYFEIDSQKALNWYEKAASNDDHEAAYIAAIMLAEDYNIRPDSARQVRYLRQAAFADHPAAMADYGLLVYQGAGVERSEEDAAEWFRKSAQAGDSEGQFLYAYTLAKGEGVAQSFEDAYYWLLKSGQSTVPAYQKDRDTLKSRLEDNVDLAVIESARSRFDSEQNISNTRDNTAE